MRIKIVNQLGESIYYYIDRMRTVSSIIIFELGTGETVSMPASDVQYIEFTDW